MQIVLEGLPFYFQSEFNVCTRVDFQLNKIALHLNIKSDGLVFYLYPNKDGPSLCYTSG